MTRKHFIQMAQGISEMDCMAQRVATAEAFIKVARQVNARFDEAKFRKACGI